MASTLMASLITPARVIPRLRACDVRHVVHELVRIAIAETALDHDAVCRAVRNRGEASTFGFGRGVAIPHAAVSGLDLPVGAFARLHPPQDFGAADHIPTDLAFLLLSPDGDASTHLRALACVARRLRDREIAARLRSARDVEAIHIVLMSNAWRESNEVGTGHSATLNAGYLTNGSTCTSLEELC